MLYKTPLHVVKDTEETVLYDNDSSHWVWIKEGSFLLNIYESSIKEIKTLIILKVELDEEIWVEEKLPITFEENILIKNIIEEEKSEQYVEDNRVLHCRFVADIAESDVFDLFVEIITHEDNNIYIKIETGTGQKCYKINEEYANIFLEIINDYLSI